MTRSRAMGLAAIVLAMLAGAVAALTPLEPALRFPLGLALVTFIPGYAVARAIFPGWHLDWATMLVLAIGLSLSMAALGAILLDVVPTGINAETWTALLILITVGAALVAVRRSSSVVAPADQPRPGRSIDRRRVLFQGACFGIALVIVVGGFALAIRGVEVQPRPGFTQLWLMPTSDPEVVAVGVQNKEHQAVTMNLKLTMGTVVEAEWPAITLQEGQTWEATAPVPGFSATTVPLEGTLTLTGTPDAVYRHVTLWHS